MKAARFRLCAARATRRGAGRAGERRRQRQAPRRRTVARPDAEPAAGPPAAAGRHVAARGADADRGRRHAPGASAPASPMRGIEDARGKFPAARCCARWPAASPTVRCATAAPSAAASRMPIRRPTGRSRWPHWAPPSIIRGDGGTRSVPVERFVARRLHHGAGATTRSSSRSTCRSSPAPARYGYYKFCRKTGEFAEASAAAVFDPETGAARIFLGALRGTPLPLECARAQVAAQGQSAASTEVVTAGRLAEAGARSRCRSSGAWRRRRDRARSTQVFAAMMPVALTVNGRAGAGAGRAAHPSRPTSCASSAG